MKLQYLADRLSALQKEALYREVSSFEPVSATHVKQRGRKFLMMASNDYLGLTHHPSEKPLLMPLKSTVPAPAVPV